MTSPSPSPVPAKDALEALLAKAAEVATDPLRFGAYFNDPVGFCKDVLGVSLWERQRQIAEAVAHDRRVAVKSGHGIGKTFLMACLTLWWLYARRGLVVTTGPTKEQVEDVLWREIAERANLTLVPLPGKTFGTEHRVSPTWYAVGITTEKAEAFQGRHHEHLLVIIDEAPGVQEHIHLAIASLATGAKNTIVMIGNPTQTSGTFYDAFRLPGWTRLHASCLDHPNVRAGRELIPGAVTREWVEERRVKWGEHHPLWYSRVLGEFPKISTRGVIPLAWIERAQNEERRLQALTQAREAKLPRVGGLDVARYGDNLCVLFVRTGDAIEAVESWSHASLMETAGRALEAIKVYKLAHLVVDASGIGAGVVDRLLEQSAPVFAYNGGHRAFTPGAYANRRSEMWWHLRQRFEKERLWLPPGQEQLVSDLVTPEYELMSSGRLRVETKEKLLERGVKSPDFADALTLCFALDADPEAELAQPIAANQDPTPAYAIYPGLDAENPFDQLPEGF